MNENPKYLADLDLAPLFQTMMENLPDSIYFKDLSSRFVAVSKAKVRKHGFENPGDLIGKTDADLFTGEHASVAREVERQIIEGEILLFRGEERLTWADGHETWASTIKLPWRDASGKIIGTFGLSRDVTEKKQAEAEREKLLDEVMQASRMINTLTGLLPICASCKKIRDESGSWSEVETYLQKRSKASFTHGICPGCAQKLYPDMQEPE